MPTYAYLCRACGRPFEIQMSIREKEDVEAPLSGVRQREGGAATLRLLRRGRGRNARPGRVMPPRPRRSLRVRSQVGK